MDRSLHPNGGGWILGTDVSISSDSKLDSSSRLSGKTVVSYGSSITSNSEVHDSEIVLGDIRESALTKSNVAAALVYDSGLREVVVRGTVGRNAVIQKCVLGHNVVVEGCTLRNVVLDGPYLIHSDFNKTPPHYLLETDRGVRMGLVKCSNDRFHCGCVCRTFDKWLSKKETLRTAVIREGWPADAVDLIHQLFSEWRDY